MSKYGTNLLTLWDDHIERCGFILKNKRPVEVQNRHEDPTSGFRISEEDLQTYLGRAIATWHTHPNDNPNLSIPDYFLFSRLSEMDHVIIAQYAFRIYRAIGSRIVICENDCI